MNSVRRDTGRAWIAFLMIPVLVAIASVASLGATPAAAQDDQTATPEVVETTVPVAPTPEAAETTVPATPTAADEEAITPGPEDTPSGDVPDRSDTAPEPDVIGPVPDDGEEPGLIEPAPADAPEEEQQVIAPAPDDGDESGLIEPAPAGVPEQEEALIAPPPTGMGHGDEGGASPAIYALLALAGLGALMGLAVLTWRFRLRRA